MLYETRVVLVSLKFYWAPDFVDFVVGRFSHFNMLWTRHRIWSLNRQLQCLNVKIYRGQTPQYLALSEIWMKRAHPGIVWKRFITYYLTRFELGLNSKRLCKKWHRVLNEFIRFVLSLQILTEHSIPLEVCILS